MGKKYASIDEVRKTRIDGLNANAYHGVAIAAEIALDQGILIANDTETVLRLAHRLYGPEIKEDGSAKVVLVAEQTFAELLSRAGLSETESA
jgi:hypothetical protein